MKRRLFVASSLASLGLSGCGPIKDALTNGPFHSILTGTESLNRAVIDTHGMARLYPDSAVGRIFGSPISKS